MNKQQHHISAAAVSANHLISDAEFIEIERVMQRASMIDQKESDRIKYATRLDLCCSNSIVSIYQF
jgi:hypothetical protein